MGAGPDILADFSGLNNWASVKMIRWEGSIAVLPAHEKGLHVKRREGPFLDLNKLGVDYASPSVASSGAGEESSSLGGETTSPPSGEGSTLPSIAAAFFRRCTFARISCFND